MKVRIGVSLGMEGAPDGFAAAVDLLEAARIDSLWLPEHVYGQAVEPFTGMAFALSRTRHLKAGSGISVLPGRHPALVAKQLASLAGLAPRRVLPVFGLQPAAPSERAAFPVPAGPGQRAAVFDEALTLLRRLLTADEPVTFEGRFFSVSGASAGPRPAEPLDIWLAGSAPGALRRRPAGGRMARLADDARRGGRGGARDPGISGRGRTPGRSRALRDEHADSVRGTAGRGSPQRSRGGGPASHRSRWRPTDGPGHGG